MTPRTLSVLFLWLGAITISDVAFAQGVSAPSARPRVLFDVGALVVGPADAGTTTAVYVASDGTPVTQFAIDRTLTAGAGVAARLQFRTGARLAIELNGAFVRPKLRARVSADEEADAATIESPANQFTAGAGALFFLRSGGAWQPFARGSFGWLRELSDDFTLYQDGWTADAGGGALWRWTDRPGRFRPFGLRFDGGVNIRHGGLALSDKARLLSVFASAAFVLKL